MSNNVFPGNLPGLTYDSVRSPNFNTGIQQALSGKESRIAYQQYNLMSWTLTYEVLRDNLTVSELKALFGLFMASSGKYDDFLYLDPQFNTVTHMPFAVTDGVTTGFQLTATYQNAGGPGAAELIQNGNPYTMEIMRYGSLIEYASGNSRTQYALHSQDFTNAVWNKESVTVAVASQMAPDGTATANVLTDSTTSSVTHDVSQTFSGATASASYCGSVFAWGGPTEAAYLWLYLQDSVTGDTAYAVFDRAIGTIVSTATTGSSWNTAIAAVGVATTVSGYPWYRLSLSAFKATTNPVNLFIRPSSSPTSPTYAGTVGVATAVIWGAQFENAGIVSPLGGSGITYPTMYLPATTAVVTQQDWTGIGATGIMNFNTANLASIAGIQLLWSGTFFYRVRFDDDAVEFKQIMNELWAVDIKLRQVKL